MYELHKVRMYGQSTVAWTNDWGCCFVLLGQAFVPEFEIPPLEELAIWMDKNNMKIDDERDILKEFEMRFAFVRDNRKHYRLLTSLKPHCLGRSFEVYARHSMIDICRVWINNGAPDSFYSLIEDLRGYKAAMKKLEKEALNS